MSKINRSEIQIRDPFVFAENGVWYLFGSTDKDIWEENGTGFDVYKSDGDLDEWDGPYPAFRPPAGFWSTKNFWAPEVYYYDTAYFMFATFQRNAGFQGGRRGTAILRSGSVTGPYLPWSDGPVTPPG
jgi:hypothetical protein